MSKATSTGSQSEKFVWDDALVHHMLGILHERMRREERHEKVDKTAFNEFA